MSESQSPTLRPEVDVACAICGGGATALVCSAAEVAAQLEYLEGFHRRRLRASGRGASDDALADRSDFTQDYATDIVSCSDCGLVFRETRPRAAEVTAAYESDRYGRERLDALFASQLELYRGKLRRLDHFRPRGPAPRVVEIGSFVGGFLAAARDAGWDAVGVDPGEEVAAYCREKGLVVHETTAASAPIEPDSVDCVAIWNTFDQLPEPRTALLAGRRWLRDGGVLVVRVPNGACFRGAIEQLRRLPERLAPPVLAALAWNNLLAFPYLNGHSPGTLDRLLAPSGVESLAVDADVLTRLADEHTKAWAAWEEYAVKLSWRALARAGIADPPWFDAYYRRIA